MKRSADVLISASPRGVDLIENNDDWPEMYKRPPEWQEKQDGRDTCLAGKNGGRKRDTTVTILPSPQITAN